MEFPRSLRIAILPLNGLFEVNNANDGKTKITGGLEADYLQILSQALNFKMDIHVPEDGEWGREDENGSWTGLIGMILRNESDIALGGLAVTEKRYQVIEYSVPYRYTFLTFATHKPSSIPKFATFLYPFTLNLWIVLAVHLMIMPLVFKFLQPKKLSIGEHIFSVAKPLLNKPLKVRRNDPTQVYFFLGAWLIGTTLLTFSYSATFLSLLTIPLYEPGVQNLQHLAELVSKGTFRAGAFKGTNVLNILRASQHKSIAAMADHIESNKYHIEPSIDAVKKFYDSKHSALITDETYFQMNFPNTLKLSPEPIKCTGISMATSKSFCCNRKLNSHISRIFESGLSQKIVRQVLTRIEINGTINTVYYDRSLTLDLEHFSGVFAFFIIGNVFAVITLFIEIIIAKSKLKISAF